MDKELLIYFSSIGYIFVVICIGLILYKTKVLAKEGSRKFIHIGVSNWILFWYFGLTDLFLSLSGPIFFIFANLIFVLTPLKKMLGLNNLKRDMGLIYFPIALTFSVYMACVNLIPREYALCAILAMGYGDGVAAVVGQKWGRHKYNVRGNNKSFEGTLAMFVNLLIISLVFIQEPFYIIVLLALVPTLLEAFIGYGLDNIAVPLSYIIFGLIL